MSKVQGDRQLKVVKALSTFPYFVLREEATDYNTYCEEVKEIKDNYISYNEGVPFLTEGTSGDYVASNVPYKLAKTLIDKEARFMFSQSPDIVVRSRTTDEKEKNMVEQYQKLIDEVLRRSGFSRRLLMSAKDCLIGKRVACLVDFSETDGILVHFYNSLQFYYETEYGTDRIIKFVSFECVNKVKSNYAKRYLVNRYVERNGIVYMSSILYNGAGEVVEVLIEEKPTELAYIPAVVILNDGTLEDSRGVSEIEDLEAYESAYSRLANSDIDSERKGMNPIRYTVDMNPDTTENLPSGPGAYWDLLSNQNQNNNNPSVGVIAPSMDHTESVKTTLDRIKTTMYQSVDVPDISEETMVGSITSGKALKAIYWGLMVRCDEKMKMWIPALESMANMILDYAKLEPQVVTELYLLEQFQDMQVQITVIENYALLDDETEEKASDMQEIAQNTRSRKSYLKKWRRDEFSTDKQVDDELYQIAMELNMFDTMSMNTQVQSRLNRQGAEEEVQSNVDETQRQEEEEQNQIIDQSGTGEE